MSYADSIKEALDFDARNRKMSPVVRVEYECCPRHGWFDVTQGGCEPCESEALRAQERAEDEAYRRYIVES